MDRIDYIEFFNFRWIEPDELLLFLCQRCRNTKIHVRRIDFTQNTITFSYKDREITLELVFAEEPKMAAFTSRQLIAEDKILLDVIQAEPVYRTLMEELGGSIARDMKHITLEGASEPIMSPDEINALLRAINEPEPVEPPKTLSFDEINALLGEFKAPEPVEQPECYKILEKLKNHLVGRKTASGKEILKVDLNALGEDYHYGIDLEGEFIHLPVARDVNYDLEGLCKEFLEKN